MNEIITDRQQNQIGEWTEMKYCDILIDSEVDEWTKEMSVFNERIIGKKQIKNQLKSN